MLKNERVINPANKLVSYEIKIGEIPIVSDAIASYEVKYCNDSPRILGNLIFDDLYDMNSQVDWNDILVEVSYSDLSEEITKHTFKVTSVKEYEHSIYKKAFILKIQDIFSYKLQHSFLSKGFNSTTSSALKKYITHVCGESIGDLALNISDSEDKSVFTVPKNINNLDFFIDKLMQSGCTFYQTREGVFVKRLDEISASNLDEEVDVFTDETDNALYKNRVIASRISTFERNSIVPRMRSFAYNSSKKIISFYSKDDKTSFLMNDNDANIQDDVGYNDVYQQHLNFKEHDLAVRTSYLKQNELIIVVSGFYKNNVNKIITINLRGNTSTPDGQITGNIKVNGKYIVHCVHDKIIGDSLIQKLTIQRADMQNAIE